MKTFSGFSIPKQNYSKLPHALIDHLPDFETVGELKVVLYVLRHTWGYSEYGIAKRITTDEFMHGRKRNNGRIDDSVNDRIDGGCGLSKDSVIDGLRRAVEHGFLIVEEDASDAARIKKSYALNILAEDQNQVSTFSTSGQEVTTPAIGNPDIRVRKSRHRTEKETNIKKDTPKKPSPSSLFCEAMRKHFKITVNPDWKAHLTFLRWAIDDAKITPEMVEYARLTWAHDDTINWSGKRSITMTAVMEEWEKLIEGYYPVDETQADGFSRIDMNT